MWAKMSYYYAVSLLCLYLCYQNKKFLSVWIWMCSIVLYCKLYMFTISRSFEDDSDAKWWQWNMTDVSSTDDPRRQLCGRVCNDSYFLSLHQGVPAQNKVKCNVNSVSNWLPFSHSNSVIWVQSPLCNVMRFPWLRCSITVVAVLCKNLKVGICMCVCVCVHLCTYTPTKDIILSGAVSCHISAILCPVLTDRMDICCLLKK